MLVKMSSGDPCEQSHAAGGMTRIPHDVLDKLKTAVRKCSSLIGRVATRSITFARPDRRDANALLERIRHRQKALGPVDLNEEALRELRRDGRP